HPALRADLSPQAGRGGEYRTAPPHAIPRVLKGSAPGQVVVAEGQIPIALPGDLEDGIGNAGLNRGAAVVTHAIQPMPGLEEGDVNFRRVLVDTRQQESVEVTLRNAAFRD